MHPDEVTQGNGHGLRNKEVSMKRVFVFLPFFFFASTASAADIQFSWNPSKGAKGYKIQMSTDRGASWDQEKDAGEATEFVWKGAPDRGLLLFRVSAYNEMGEAVRGESGTWYNGDWLTPEKPNALESERSLKRPVSPSREGGKNRSERRERSRDSNGS